MPFDPAGNFTRVHNWQQDRDNGIRILADRHDAEDDNFGSAFNLTFLRTGTVPMTGNLQMGGNAIRNIDTGSEAAPSVTFELSNSTGLWQPNPNAIAISAAGVKRFEVNNGGASLTGNLYVSDSLTTGFGVGAGVASLEVGGDRTADGYSVVDLHSAVGTDYDARIVREPGTHGNLSLLNTGNGAFVLTTFGAGDIVLSPAGNEVMRLKAGTNLVGIGNDNPVAKLHIGGHALPNVAVRIDNANTNGSADIIFTDTGVQTGRIFAGGSTFGSYAGVKSLNYDTSAGGAHAWYAGGPELMRMAPNGQLTVNSNITAQGAHNGGGISILYNQASPASRNWDIVNDVGVYGDLAFRRADDQAASTYSFVWYSDSVRNFYCYGPTLGLATYGEGKIGLKVGGVANSGYIEFFKTDGQRQAYIGYIPAAGGGIMHFNETGGSHHFNNGVLPNTDNTGLVGNSNFRWAAVWATNGAIQTSDEREKDWLGAPDEAGIKAAGRIIDELGFFTWNTGGDTSIHFGVRAQQVLRILMEEGIEELQNIDFEPGKYIKDGPKLRYSLVQFDSWEETSFTTPPPASPFPDIPETTEEVPSPVEPPVAEKLSAMPPTVNPAGNRFSMNLAELGLFVAAAQHARLNALTARVKHVEAHVHGEPAPE